MFWKNFKKKYWSIITLWFLFSGIAGLCFLVVIFTPLANWLAEPFYVQSDIQKADAILVLSGGSYDDGSLTMTTMSRVMEGVSLYKKGLAKKVILVGDTGNQSTTDAQRMKNFAIQLNVLPEDIFIGNRSTNTYLDLLEAKKIIESNHFQKVLLITSSIHTRRSLWTAHGMGLSLIPASSSADQYRQVSVDRLILFWYELREICSMLIYRLNGWI